MRLTAIWAYLRWLGIAGVGSYLGAAAAGVVGVATGVVFSSGATWLLGLPFVMVPGAAITPGVAYLTRRWLLPNIRRRTLWSVAAGAALAPLAVAAGQMGGLIKPIALPLMLLGAMLTVALRIRWSQQPYRTPSERRESSARTARR